MEEGYEINVMDIFEAYIRAMLILDAVENGWSVRKVSDSSIQFKKRLQQYILEDIESNDTSLFSNFVHALATQIDQE